MCARVTSTYMEFTFTFGPKPEFKFSFNFAFICFFYFHKKILKNKTNVRKALPFSNKVWYYKSKANTCSENMFGMYV